MNESDISTRLFRGSASDDEKGKYNNSDYGSDEQSIDG